MSEWKFPGFGHGGDYNPDQWRHIEGIFEQDIRLMKLSGCNLMSVGIFSWAALEPEDGKFDFGWLDHVIDELHKNGIYTMLATPSGARPAWMSLAHPEVLRVQDSGQRIEHSARHNHCYTSPTYRKYVQRINGKLAERYGKHPGVVGWHLSNEYNGACYCDLCIAGFRKWLETKYQTIDNLNHAWWLGFWSKLFNSFDQIGAPKINGERGIHGLNLDWKRYTTDMTIDFMKAEAMPIKKHSTLPITTNMMGVYEGLDYFRFHDVIDVASHDLYPQWGSPAGDYQTAVNSAFAHDLTRSLLKKPFLLMESTPSMVNWHKVNRPKRPGMHMLASVQAVAHGADTVQYFQWRKSRGASEKFHGAVVDHVGHEHTRVFKDVADLGAWLKDNADIAHTQTQSDVAIIFDWNNRWALKDAQGMLSHKGYEETVYSCYEALLRQGVNVDVIDMESALDGYKLVVAPMLYMIKPGVKERFTAFVEGGGTLVCTYGTGFVDENDLCFLGGFPGPLRELLGVWIEETDALYEGETRSIAMKKGNPLGIEGDAECFGWLDLCHAEGAEVIAEYAEDFYAGRPALTRNAVGKGSAWFVAARTGEAFLTKLFAAAAKEAGVTKLAEELPEGVIATQRDKYLFLMNFADKAADVNIGDGLAHVGAHQAVVVPREQ